MWQHETREIVIYRFSLHIVAVSLQQRFVRRHSHFGLIVRNLRKDYLVAVAARGKEQKYTALYCISARLCSVWLEFRAAKLSGSFDYGIVSGIYQLQIYGQLWRLRRIISACLLSWRCCRGIGVSDAAVTQIAAQHPKQNHVDRRTELPDVRLILNIAPHIFADFTIESM